MRIAVLMGGESEERDVSLASGCEVARALREAGHEVKAVDTREGLLTPADEARVLGAGVRAEAPATPMTRDRGPAPTVEGGVPDTVPAGGTDVLERAPELSSADVVFLALHGGAGEDGTVQGLLDVAGVRYVGSGRLGCALSMDKDITKRLLKDAGIATPDWLVGELEADEVEDRLGLPVIVKPVAGGSTVGLTLVHRPQDLEAATRAAAALGEGVMYEGYVRGRELTVGILGERALPVGEIIPEHEIFDYECKYQPGMAQEIFPAELDPAVAGRIQELALQVHRVLRLRDFSRVDFILDPQGVAWCLEANALPGLTANSLLPKAARAAGITFPELCERIARLALDRESRGAFVALEG